MPTRTVTQSDLETLRRLRRSPEVAHDTGSHQPAAPSPSESVRPVEPDRPRRRPLWRRVLRLLFNTIRNGCTLAVILYLIVSAFYDRTRMVSASMGPTLDGEEDRGDWVLVYKYAYRSHPPRRGDLVYFRNFEGMLVIKRVAGMPGDMIRIKDGKAVINGRPLDDPPIFRELTYDNCGMFRSPKRKVAVRAGWYFVMGDNTRDSYDSRFHGPIKAEQILGRPDFIYWPLKRLGPVR